MVPVGEVRHRTSSSFMDKSPDGDRFKAGPEKYRFEHEHTGFWSRISTVTLFLPIEFRGMTPVWMFVLSGCFTKSDNSDFDRDLIERVDSHVHEAHRQTFQMRRNGDTFHYFRAPNYTADNLSYNSHWVGDFKDFNGVEKVTLGDSSIVWRANFFGRLIDPIS
jgi:hypothetical protein